MDTRALDKMNKDELRGYLDFIIWHYRVVDAFWFICTSEALGQSTAETLNERVWAKAGGLGAREIIKRFNVTARGVDGFVEALNLFPWTMIIGYEVERNGDEAIINVPSCPVQEARLKRGDGEYVCKFMHQSEFINFAKEIDDRIRIECIYAPPDPHPEESFCKWRVYMQE